MSSTDPVGSAVSWIRSNGAVLVEHRDTLTIIGADGVVRTFADSSADLMRLVLDVFATPHSQAQLYERVRAVDAAIDRDVLSEVVRVLVAAGAVVPGAVESRPSRSDAPPRGRIVLGVSGAVAAVDVPVLARLLIAHGFEVAIIMTESARMFVTAESLAAITHRPVLSSFWSEDLSQPAPHIRLSTWADLVVIYPASAATLARIAGGLTEDLLAATVVASEVPVILAPSMNDAMFRAPSVQRNLEQLRKDGFHVVLPRFGVEVATAPHARTAILGAAHPASEIAQVVELLWNSAVRPKRVETADRWEREYSSTPLARLPWFTDELDDDLAAALTVAAQAGARRLLDIGTGPGTTAIFAAQHGFDVVASDISATALMLAKRRAQALPIAWVLDDFSASRLWGKFDVAVDRGCLHSLRRAQWPSYAEHVARLLVTGGQLLLKHHAVEEGTRCGTQPPAPGELESLFGADFAIAETAESRFGGAAEGEPRALFARLVRR